MRNTSIITFALITSLIIGCTSPEPSDSLKEQLSNNFSEEEQELIKEIKETDILFWDPDMQLLGYQNTHEVSPIRFLSPAEEPYPLEGTDREFSGFSYTYDGRRRGVNDFMEEMNIAGLLIIRDGAILLERYGYNLDETTTWISFSVTKSVLSMLFGAAIADGYIEAADNPVTDYLPELKGSAYDEVTIRHLLQMSSGVGWNEDYSDPDSDVARLDHIHSKDELISYMAQLPRVAEPGTRFNYNTGETNLAGALLTKATGQSLTEYANNTIWQEFGMEHPATWKLIGEEAMEHGGCCISASLRDYGRLGLMALRNGRNHKGEQILPENWMNHSLSPSAGHEGYGFFWWLEDQHLFEARGIFGQYLHINKKQDLVIAMLGKWEQPTGDELQAHRRELVKSFTEYLRIFNFSDKKLQGAP